MYLVLVDHLDPGLRRCQMLCRSNRETCLMYVHMIRRLRGTIQLLPGNTSPDHTDKNNVSALLNYPLNHGTAPLKDHTKHGIGDRWSVQCVVTTTRLKAGSRYGWWSSRRGGSTEAGDARLPRRRSATDRQAHTQTELLCGSDCAL